MNACYAQGHVGVNSVKGKLSKCILKIVINKTELKNIKILCQFRLAYVRRKSL